MFSDTVNQRAAVAKLMWILGRTTDQKEVEELFYTPVACDILTKR